MLLWFFVPATPVHGPKARFDPIGAVGLGVGLVSLLLAVSKGADWGWASSNTLGLFATTAVALTAWGWWELRTPEPLVDLRVIAGRQVLLTNAASVVVGFAMYAQSLIVPQLLQLPASTGGYGLGQSMLAMGLWMAPLGPDDDGGLPPSGGHACRPPVDRRSPCSSAASSSRSATGRRCS